jgi:DNA-binding MurR/RpiR family transcriptional regulator
MATPTTVYINPQQRKRLFQRARRRKSSFSEELREAIDLYLDFPPDFDKESLAALAKEANASLNRSIVRLDDAIAHCKRTMERIDELERR